MSDEIRRALEAAVNESKARGEVVDGPFTDETPSPLRTDLLALRQRVREATKGFDEKSQNALIEEASRQWARKRSSELLAAHEAAKYVPSGMTVVEALEAVLSGATLAKPDVALIEGDPQGRGLFYRGLVNGIFGDGSVGKSLTTTEVQARTLNEGGTVVHWEADGSPLVAIIERLLNAGAKPEAIRSRLHVFYTLGDRDHFLVARGAEAVSLVTLDALNPMITSFDHDPYHPSGVDKVTKECFDPFTRHGACGVFIDHVGHENKERQAGTIRKSQSVQGALYEAVSITSPAPGRIGRTKLVLRKDNRGTLAAFRNKTIAVVVMESHVEAGAESGELETRFTAYDPAVDYLSDTASLDPIERLSRELDRLGVERTAGRPTAATALKAAGIRFDTNDLRKVITARKGDSRP